MKEGKKMDRDSIKDLFKQALCEFDGVSEDMVKDLDEGWDLTEKFNFKSTDMMSLLGDMEDALMDNLGKEVYFDDQKAFELEPKVGQIIDFIMEHV